MTEIYRRNAGIVVFNRQRQVLLCKRNDVAEAWQFPQGGIEDGESPQQAALRELKEETSIVSATPVKTLDKPARYTFPPQIITSMKKRGFMNIGQDMFWTLAFFSGNDAEINLNTAEAEFSEFCWTDLQTAYDKVVEFKKSAYKTAVDAFAPLIAEYKI